MGDPGSHARHDRFAIADAIGGGFAPSTIRTCPACGAMHADLLVLQRALRDAWAPRRTRDLRLTTADAARLRRRGWRAVLGLIGTARDPITRPVALTLTGLGLAGLLLSTVPPNLSMSGAAAAPPEVDKVVVPMAGNTSEPTHTTARQSAPPADQPAISVPVVSAAMIAVGGAIVAVRRVGRAREGVR